LQRENSITGSLLGSAVGDALGLPLEGLPPQRARKLFGEIGDNFEMCLLANRGLVSDDTEHAILVLQAAVAARDDVEKFQNDLARRLKFWFVLLPPGVGLATAKSYLKLLLGFAPVRSGVHSAGNGPAMRAPILGVLLSDDAQLRAFVRASTRLTHTDAKAEWGALVVAFAARYAADNQYIAPGEFLEQWKQFANNGDNFESENIIADELFSILRRVVQSVDSAQSTPNFAAALGLQYGVSGYIFHTVPVCLHAWLSYQNDFQKAILETLRCGGDADSTAAIVGGMIGARVGKEGIPQRWRDAIAEWPHTVGWMESAAQAASRGEKVQSAIWFFPATAARNLFLLAVVLAHGFRRILPPY
jgi:ADP-ribosylglycohydrolase